MKIGMFGLIGAAALASAASADFMGFESELITLGNGHVIMNVYAKFSNANDRVLNVYNTNITTTHAGGFFQAESSPFWRPGTTQNKNTSDDSWLLVGANPNGSGNAGGAFNGMGSSLTSDPNFVNFDDGNGSSDFSFIEGTGGGAGWYNGNPANSYGYAFDAGRVLLAHFTFDSNQGAVNWNATLTIKLNGANESVSGVGTGNNTFLIPAPGALALIGMAGLVSRRRRA